MAGRRVEGDEAACSRADPFGPVAGLHTTASEARAVLAVHAHVIDVVFTDVMLPDGDGISLVAELRQLDPTLGAVVATGVDDPRTAERAVELGVQGYLLKPFEMTEARINAANAAHWRRLEQENREHRERLSGLVDVRTRALERSRAETINRLSVAAEHRDMETSSHLERMSAYAAILARRAGLDPDHCEQIRLASPMHDIGKLGIPDHVLLHDGPFTPEQRRLYPLPDIYETMRPGLTGRWQTGPRGEGADFAGRAGEDARYRRELSFLADLKILARTCGVVLQGRGQ